MSEREYRKKLRMGLDVSMMYGFLSLIGFITFYVLKLLPKLSGISIVTSLVVLWWGWIPSFLLIGVTYYLLTRGVPYVKEVKKV